MVKKPCLKVQILQYKFLSDPGKPGVRSMGPSLSNLGTGHASKSDEFWKNSEGGVGSFSIQKFILQNLDL